MTLFSRIFITAVLIIILPIAAFADEVVIPFESGQANILDVGGGQVRLEVPGFTSSVSAGDPDLPCLGKYVLLPPNTDLRTVRVEIRNAVEDKVSGSFAVAPAPPSIAYVDGKKLETWGSDKSIQNGRDTLVYEKDAFYPANYADLDYGQKLDTYQLLPVRFWPYRYNPASGAIIHLASADVAVIFDRLPIATAAAGVPGDEDQLRDLAVNWQQASTWYGSPSNTVMAADANTGLAIVTTSAIAGGSTKLTDYINHKTNLGYTVSLITEDQWGGGTGNTAAENLRAWLQVNYLNRFKYLLLIGNSDPSNGNVPMKMTWPRHGEGDGYEEAPTDYYYADLTGNWDLNGNGYYGETSDFGTGGIDTIPELYVGRIPYYNSIPDLDKILQKIISYETATSVSGWAQRFLLPMKPLDDSTPMYQLGEAIRNDAAIPGWYQYCRVYENNYSLTPVPEITPCTEAGVLAEWKKHYGFVFWSTHGSETSASDVMYSSDCSSLDDAYPSFVFQGSCLNGKPESSSNLGYSLLKNGAIATVSASRVSWYYPGQTNYVNSDSDPGMTYTYSIKLARNHQKCGEALLNMKTSLPRNNWMNWVVFNLYGDPTVTPKWPTDFAIETTTLPGAKVGQTYRAELHAVGGNVPYKWALASGALPQGVTLSAAGIIAGIPQVMGVFNFTAKVTDYAGVFLTRDYTLVVPRTIYSFNFDTDPGWTCEGDWAYGTPTGAGSNNHDPTSGHTGTKIYGYNLAGDYTNSMPAAQYLTTRPIDCSALAGTTLSFWRWLGVENARYDHAAVDVSSDGTNWTRIWSNPESTLTESAWTQQIYDISAVADAQKTVYIRWGMGTTDGSGVYSGWNIDDLEIIGGLNRPLIQHTPPGITDATTGNYTISADIIFASTPLAGNPVLHWSAGVNFADVAMTKLTGDTYRGYIPAQPTGTIVRYYFTAADAMSSSMLPSDAPSNCFQLNVIKDTQPPAIVHTPLADTTDTSGVYPVTATVTDNLGVYSVTLSWTKNDGSSFLTGMSKTGNPNEYRGNITGSVTPGDWINYKITAYDISASHLQSTNPTAGWNTFNITRGKTQVYSFPLNTNPGWVCEGGWAFGVPTGAGSGKKDPTSGHTGSNVYGYNLSGDYSNSMTDPVYLTSAALNMTGIRGATLKFWRWLGIEKYTFDHATVDVSNDGVIWTTIWSNSSDATTDDGAWVQQSYDISSVADGQPAVYVRWGLGKTDSSVTYCGWNIDDIEIWGSNFASIDSIAALKTRPDRGQWMLSNCVVTAAFNGYFYTQDPANYQGIKVIWPGVVTEGSQVTIMGLIRTRDGERELLATSVQ